MRIAKPLINGARVAVLAPASGVPDGQLESALEAIGKWGLEPVVYESARSTHGYLAGQDTLRASDINHAFADTSISGILCVRGGYGSQRLMDKIDWNLIKSHPKRFFGYSDITALHIQLNQACDLESYHTPMPSTEWNKGIENDEYACASLRCALFGGMFGQIANRPGESRTTVTSGKAQGILTGGNLSLVVSSLGTPYAIETQGRILFLEDIGEAPYRLDGMLTQMKNAGKLSDCAGILLGYFTDCNAKDPARSLSIEQVVQEIIKPLGVPCIAGLSCGHSDGSMCLPMGRIVQMDADTQIVYVMEE